jgi:hypothetical protein
MSLNKKQRKKVKIRDNLVINKKEFLDGMKALAIFHEEKMNTFIAIRQDLGDEHPATQQMFDEIDNLSNILTYFSSLLKPYNKNFDELN